LRVALVSSELAGVAETRRARVARERQGSWRRPSCLRPSRDRHQHFLMPGSRLLGLLRSGRRLRRVLPSLSRLLRSASMRLMTLPVSRL